MYTSGSTGLPKGVPITHAGVFNLVNGQTYCPFDASRVHLLLSNLSFDFSTLELWGALLVGARLAGLPSRFDALYTRCAWATPVGEMCGPSRGSAAGSLT